MFDWKVKTWYLVITIVTGSSGRILSRQKSDIRNYKSMHKGLKFYFGLQVRYHCSKGSKLRAPENCKITAILTQCLVCATDARWASVSDCRKSSLMHVRLCDECLVNHSPTPSRGKNYAGRNTPSTSLPSPSQIVGFWSSIFVRISL